ncbi:putative integral membrane protein [Neisseria gonorrhoeae]|uniref:Putative integral membrane protein n=1 Tax=Neisseria gonorrhoeae TaxID=485 RepID=A0A378VXU3_NEIGO|nr:putative integral membrane protein [Neisseria gonorrhoeae]
MIPIVVSAGGHPLAFGISIAVLGLLMALFRGGSIMAKLTSNGVCGGLLLYLGFIGTTGQVKNCFRGQAVLICPTSLLPSLL